MSSITIHSIDENLNKKIKDLANKKNLSLNKVIKLLLKKQLGLSKQDKIINHKNDFKEFCCVWEQKQVKEFEKSIEELNTVNPNDWK